MRGRWHRGRGAAALGWPGQGAATVGLGVSASDAGASPTSTAAVRIHHDSSVTLFTGSTELGQGSRTVLSMIVAEELGVPLEQRQPDQQVPLNGGGGGITTAGSGALSTGGITRQQ